jgi:radical SAM superfamily enzyme YgiQ (UPF0313 family)
MQPKRLGVYFGHEGPPPPEHGGRLPMALIFPGEERLAYSTLGWQAVYRLAAASPLLAVERFFIAGRGAIAAPKSIESGRPLSDFPLLTVSLNFEEELRELLAGLMAAGIPVRQDERKDWPLVLAGGPLVWLNPAPILPGLDAVFVGEAEAGLGNVFDGLAREFLAGESKAACLESIVDLPGVLVPGKSSLPVRKVSVGGVGRDLAEPAFSCFVSPQAEFRDMLLIEVNRGCPYGCRFCAAGFAYRPPRQAREADLKRIVEETEPRKVGLVGTALTDWSALEPFLAWLKERKVAFGLSSLRADGLTDNLLAVLRKSGVRTVTLALEAASHRLRKAANKRLREEDFLAAVERCARHGVNRLKVYLIIGWPDETDADYRELEEFFAEIDAARQRGRKSSKGLELITFSLSPLVPKPWTPLQWAPMASEESLNRRVKAIKQSLKPFKGMRAEADPVFSARLQGYLARAGEEAFDLALAAAEQGGWRKAVKALGADFGPALDTERDAKEVFPWEIVDLGVRREFLWQEWQRYHRTLATPVCPDDGCGPCAGCGMAG